MVKKIIKFPIPSLRKICVPVTFPISDIIQQHIVDLRDTLAVTPHGVALASNQIAADGYRLFVVRPNACELPEVVINPEFIEVSEEKRQAHEGCLSVPELWTNTSVPVWAIVVFRTMDNSEIKVRISGLAAQIFQHEQRHLNGKLLYDVVNKKMQLSVYSEVIRNRKKGL